MNGLKFKTFVDDVLKINRVTKSFRFIEENQADVVIFGPYGNDLPQPGPYTRVGYFCENILPDMSICEWAFGIPPESIVRSTNYRRIQWHGFDPQFLIKPVDFSPEQIFSQKECFCNFIYSNHVPYREALFTKLSKYKKVDAPGLSMKNMGTSDSLASEDRWIVKRKFLERYKFTLSLENGISAGYQTEKLYDAMRATSIPIYVGDPYIGSIFDTNSMICMSNDGDLKHWIRLIEDFSQMRFSEICGSDKMKLTTRSMRKIRLLLRDIRLKNLMEKYVDSLVDAVVDLDRNDTEYMNALAVPWLRGNAVQEDTYTDIFWEHIFRQSLQKRA